MVIDRATILEVSPRDGLQNEQTQLSTAGKVALVHRAVAMGARRVEVSSFVNPARVPQLADADAVFAGLRREPGVSYAALAMNDRGVERAVAAGADEVNIVVVATDTFCRRNQGVDTSEAARNAVRLVDTARRAGLFTTITIAAAFGCPFEGDVSEARLEHVLAKIAGAHADEVALADTIGCAVPGQVSARVRLARDVLGDDVTHRLHLHDTRNTATANSIAGLEAGVEVLDASLGGTGGCPFAPAATGNVATEDLVYMLDRMGVRTGIDLTSALESARWLLANLGSSRASALVKAGPFPQPGSDDWCMPQAG
ncbi:hydroxymethylglutaryl-CoA lyase [Actinomadura soli]|uniref:Hydroxymethylglutaryl-CoA lyase n=1 Tax=Actinomadura soli TaxID=2508997 RepID=A0A5C4JGC2_9ACTN|nr:hydroxymethylglutaryl-CoA lyase [Actinomadura soli]TMR04338.1 hydroxymethylglutaryl-CoA lyase [Actinomadura soli]